MNTPQFIISILDENMDYDSSTGKVVLPFSYIYYEITPQEDGTAGYQVVVMDNSIEGKVPADESGKVPHSLDPKKVSLMSFVSPVIETVSNSFPDNIIYYSLMGYEPKEDSVEKNIYHISAQLAEEVSWDFYDKVKEQKEAGSTDSNYGRILSWMEEVREKGAHNTPRTVVAMLTNKDGSSTISYPDAISPNK